MERAHVRGTLAVGLGMVITLTLGIISLVLGLGARMWFAITRLPRRFPPMVKIWSTTIEEVCYKRLLKTRVRADKLDPPGANEVVVIIANHPPTIGIPTFFWWLTKTFGGNLKVVAKHDHLKNPGALLYGWAFWAVGGGIFINRRDRDKAFASIRRSLPELANGAVITIFPDMRRPTTNNIALDHQHFRELLPNRKDRFYYTLMPRSGGLLSLINGLDQLGVKARVFDITFALDLPADGLDDLLDFDRGRVTIRAEEIPNESIPRDTSQLRTWLVRRWQQKNRLIADFQGPHPLTNG